MVNYSSVCSDWLCDYGTNLKYFWGDSGVLWWPLWYILGILSSKSLVRNPQWVGDHYGKLIFCLLWLTLWLLGQPNVFLGWLWNTLMTSLVYLGYSVLQVSGQEPSMSSKYPMKDTLSWQSSVCFDWLCGYGTSLKYFWGDSGVLWWPGLSDISLVSCPPSLWSGSLNVLKVYSCVPQ